MFTADIGFCRPGAHLKLSEDVSRHPLRASSCIFGRQKNDKREIKLTEQWEHGYEVILVAVIKGKHEIFSFGQKAVA